MAIRHNGHVGLAPLAVKNSGERVSALSHYMNLIQPLLAVAQAPIPSLTAKRQRAKMAEEVECRREGWQCGDVHGASRSSSC